MKPVAAWSPSTTRDDVEDAGLVKFDFLGLRTLTIIDWAVKMINTTAGTAGRTAAGYYADPAG